DRDPPGAAHPHHHRRRGDRGRQGAQLRAGAGPALLLGRQRQRSDRGPRPARRARAGRGAVVSRAVAWVAPLRDGIPTPADDSRCRATVTPLRSWIVSSIFFAFACGGAPANDVVVRVRVVDDLDPVVATPVEDPAEPMCDVEGPDG